MRSIRLALLSLVLAILVSNGYGQSQVEFKITAVEFDAFNPFNGQAYLLTTQTQVAGDLVTQLQAQKAAGICTQDVIFYMQIDTNNANVETGNPYNFSISLQSTKSSQSTTVTGRLTFKDVEYCQFENVGVYPAVNNAPLVVDPTYGAHPYGATINRVSATEQFWNEQFQFVTFSIINLHKQLRYKVKCSTTLTCNPLGDDGSGNVQAATTEAAQTISYQQSIDTYTFGLIHPWVRISKWYDDADIGCTDPPADDPRSAEVYTLRYPYERVLCYRIENAGAFKLYNMSITDTLCDGNSAFSYNGNGQELIVDVAQNLTITIDSTDPAFSALFPDPDHSDYVCNKTVTLTSYFNNSGVTTNVQTFLTNAFVTQPAGNIGLIFPKISQSGKEYILSTNQDFAIVELPSCSVSLAPCLWVNLTTSDPVYSQPDYCSSQTCSVYNFDDAGGCTCTEYLTRVFVTTGAPCEGNSCPCTNQTQILLNSSCDPIFSPPDYD